MFLDQTKQAPIHLIGIGGSGMSGIAEVLLARGFAVQGSDLQESSTTQRLQDLGASVLIGHRAENLHPNTRCVVVSSAVSPTNPECIEARSRRIPVIPRAEMLAELMRLSVGIAVAGAHGKTSTTSILGQLLGPLDPTVVVGGRLQHWKGSSRVGAGTLFVTEADESDRSFLRYPHVYCIVTNIDWEHVDTYRDLSDLEETFLEFINKTAFFGKAWLSADCPQLRRLRPRITKSYRTYGFAEDADMRLTTVKFERKQTLIQLQTRERHLPEITSPLLGRHQAMNVAGAIGMALDLGVSIEQIERILKEIRPADRRLQVHFEDTELAVVEDYGHHPTEISATLQALDQGYPGWKKFVIFQPHRFTRTQALMKNFVDCLSNSIDRLFILPIYAAHEVPIEGVSSKAMVEGIHQKTGAIFAEARDHFPTSDEVQKWIQAQSEPTIVLVLGAGPLTSKTLNLAHDLSNQAQKIPRQMSH